MGRLRDADAPGIDCKSARIPPRKDAPRSRLHAQTVRHPVSSVHFAHSVTT